MNNIEGAMKWKPLRVSPEWHQKRRLQKDSGEKENEITFAVRIASMKKLAQKIKGQNS